MVVSVVVGLREMSNSREVGFLAIEKSKKLTFPLVSCVGLSLMLPWIVSM